MKGMEIATPDGSIRYRIELEDLQEPQWFSDIQLKKGDYRLTILDVYKGSIWADTLIGELSFLPFDKGVADAMMEEPILRRYF